MLHLNATRTPHTLIDKNRRIFGVLAGHPMHAEDWDSVLTGAIAAIDLLASRLYFSKDDCDHCHGPQRVKAFGFSHGGGQTHPKNLEVGGGSNEDALAQFVQDPCIKRLTGFADCECLPSYLYFVLINLHSCFMSAV